jgi:hypothetical protein
VGARHLRLVLLRSSSSTHRSHPPSCARPHPPALPSQHPGQLLPHPQGGHHRGQQQQQQQHNHLLERCTALLLQSRLHSRPSMSSSRSSNLLLQAACQPLHLSGLPSCQVSHQPASHQQPCTHHQHSLGVAVLVLGGLMPSLNPQQLAMRLAHKLVTTSVWGQSLAWQGYPLWLASV